MYMKGLGGEILCKELLGGPRHRWEDNIKKDFKEVELGGMVRIDLAQDREVEGPCECGNEPSGYIKYGEFLD